MRMGDGESSSGDMSLITVDSDEMVQRRTSCSNLGYRAFEDGREEWTNEMHCMYLKSMEDSFVNELHCSMGWCRGHVQKKNDSFQQHKSFRDGVRKSFNVNEHGSETEATSEMCALMTNPWIRHFRFSGKIQAVEAGLYQDIDFNGEQEIEFENKTNIASDNISRQSTTAMSQQDSVGSNTEMSDQNFVDNNEPMKSCSARCGKRKKTEANNNAESDQVVPKDPTTTSGGKRTTLNYRC